jgi:hypothetical protein
VESRRLHPTAQLHGSQRLHQPRDGHPSRPLYVRGFPARPADGAQTHVGTKRTHPETVPPTTVVSPDESKE